MYKKPLIPVFDYKITVMNTQHTGWNTTKISQTKIDMLYSNNTHLRLKIPNIFTQTFALNKY